MLYRSNSCVIKDGASREDLDYFRTAAPASWRRSPQYAARYEAIYGPTARWKAEQFGVVMENTNETWVERPFTEQPQESPQEVSGGDFPAPGLSIGERMILEKLDQVLAMLK